jgi:hypothetical protein
MKVVIDASIFTQESGAFGNVSGAIDVSVVPSIGDTISFIPTQASAEMPPGFSGQVLVEGRIITAGADSHGLMLALEDITVETVSDAQALVAFFEHAHGLFANIYDEEDEAEAREA